MAKSFLEYSLLNSTLLSTNQLGFDPPIRPTETPLIDGGFHEYCSFNGSLVPVWVDYDPVKYTEGLIFLLKRRVFNEVEHEFEHYFLGFRILNYFDSADKILYSEFTTLLVSLTTFIGFSTYTVVLYVKKRIKNKAIMSSKLVTQNIKESFESSK